MPRAPSTEHGPHTPTDAQPEPVSCRTHRLPFSRVLRVAKRETSQMPGAVEH